MGALNCRCSVPGRPCLWLGFLGELAIVLSLGRVFLRFLVSTARYLGMFPLILTVLHKECARIPLKDCYNKEHPNP